MAIILKLESDNREFIIAPPGNHLARLFSIVDLGTQIIEWEGKEKEQRKLLFRFELHGKDNDGKPMVTEAGEPLTINKKYTWSMFETAKLRQHLEAWRGRAFTETELLGFNIEKVLDNFCMLTIVQGTNQSGKRFAKIEQISSVPYDMKERGFPKGHNARTLFSLDEPVFDQQTFNALPEWIKTEVMGCPEYKDAMGYTPAPKFTKSHDPIDDMESDIPF